MLIINEINVFYNKAQALRKVSLKVREGTIVTILGANGAGKTTLIKSISSLLKISDGEILFENTRIDNLRSDQIIRKGISTVPEGRQLFPEMTVQENLEIGAYIYKTGNKTKEALDWVYSYFDRLTSKRNQKAGTLSGGEQQMVAIGRALMSRPKLMLLDEPSMGLAPKVVELVFDIINDMKERGITILLVEQNANMALDYSDYGYVLENGAIAVHDDASHLRNNQHIKEAYLGV